MDLSLGTTKITRMGISYTEKITSGLSKKNHVGAIRKNIWKSKNPTLCRYRTDLREGLGEVYPSYSNSEKDRFVCRPSRESGIHDGFDPKMQAVKFADVFGVEKVWGGIYESCRGHGDFASKRSTRIFTLVSHLYIRNEKLCSTMVERAQHSWVWAQHHCRNNAADARGCKTERNARVWLLYCWLVLYWGV